MTQTDRLPRRTWFASCVLTAGGCERIIDYTVRGDVSPRSGPERVRDIRLLERPAAWLLDRLGSRPVLS